MTQKNETFWPQIAAHFGDRPPDRLAVAVSGGSDSLAVLLALEAWRQQGGPELIVFTVDHHLRETSTDDAKHVAKICQSLHISYQIMNWDGGTGRGNLADRARTARYTWMESEAVTMGITDLVVAHTLDDLAETFMMRLIRGAGIDGLSAMQAKRRLGRIWLHRPTLNIRRETLRAYLRARNITWCEDPTNDDNKYDRVKIRQILTTLEPLGLTADHLSGAANRINEGRVALNEWTNETMQSMVMVDNGDVLIPRKEFLSLPHDLARRLLIRAIHWINNEIYVPRGAAVERALQAIAAQDTMTLQGCVLICTANRLRVTREYAAVEKISAKLGDVWDNRWQITGPKNIDLDEDAIIRAVGPDGWRQIGHQVEKILPYQSVIATPSVWVEQEIIAAPMVGIGAEWRAELIRGSKTLFSEPYTH